MNTFVQSALDVYVVLYAIAACAGWMILIVGTVKLVTRLVWAAHRRLHPATRVDDTPAPEQIRV